MEQRRAYDKGQAVRARSDRTAPVAEATFHRGPVRCLTRAVSEAAQQCHCHTCSVRFNFDSDVRFKMSSVRHVSRCRIAASPSAAVPIEHSTARPPSDVGYVDPYMNCLRGKCTSQVQGPESSMGPPMAAQRAHDASPQVAVYRRKAMTRITVCHGGRESCLCVRVKLRCVRDATPCSPSASCFAPSTSSFRAPRNRQNGEIRTRAPLHQRPMPWRARSRTSRACVPVKFSDSRWLR